MTITIAPSRLSTLEAVLEGLMRRYRERVPAVAAITGAMIADGLIADGQTIENDHIAFRTLGVRYLGMRSLEQIFLHYGYERRDAYRFPAKKLDAFWYSPPREDLPRIFISELRVSDLAPATQALIRSYTDEVTRDPVKALNLNDAVQVDAFLHAGLWRLPSLADYQQLGAESEYAAWVIYNRYYLNHFTISVHNLPTGYDTIADFNAFLERRGFTLNDAGGTIKRSPDGLLLQSSTIAELIEVEFADRERQQIAGSYVEFAERQVLPSFAELSKAELRREHRREGFEASNADKIFESTYSSQTGRQ